MTADRPESPRPPRRANVWLVGALAFAAILAIGGVLVAVSLGVTATLDWVELIRAFFFYNFWLVAGFTVLAMAGLIVFAERTRRRVLAERESHAASKSPRRR